MKRRTALKMVAHGTAVGGFATVLAPIGTVLAAPSPLYRDSSAPIALRVQDLLKRMTLEEKVAQMVTLWGRKADIMTGLTFDADKASQSFGDGFGQLARPSDRRGASDDRGNLGGVAARWRTPEDTVAFVNAVQDWAVNQTRLGIPVLFHEESLHGYMATNATMFPQAIALAGTFDPELVRDVNTVIAKEVRARGVPFVLSPVVDIVRDPRWGRIEETFGEDPFLVTQMGLAAVEGLQGPGKFERLADDRVYATLKHMTGHGQPQRGENTAPAQISERELRENFFPPFRAIVRHTSIGAVMPSYNEIDGVPSHANQWLLRGVLRKEWGFKGVVVSDYYAIRELADIHHVAKDHDDASLLAVSAGVDFEMPDGGTYGSLVSAVRSGKMDEALINDACARILELKFRAGLFENPYGDKSKTKRVTGDKAARALALKAARKSVCLLKNDGILPLDAKSTKTVAIIGPNAKVARLGGYSSVPKQEIGLLDGVKALVGDTVNVLHAQGVYITQSEDRSADEVLLANRKKNLGLIKKAVKVAKKADVVVLAIGDTEQTSREAYATNHLGDRASVSLLGEQTELFDALKALGKPVVVLAINGRPPSWPHIADHANALMECWYLGQEGGTAMAEALFGHLNPGAKLPVSVVRSEGQIPLYYNHKPSGRRGYLFSNNTPLFPFGWGLSYTRFDISPPKLEKSKINLEEKAVLHVSVKNVGDRLGDEVVQVYIRDEVADTTRPIKLLKAFKRVTLAPGEKQVLTFELGTEAFAYWNTDNQEVVDPGEFTIMVGANSADLQSVVLTLV